MTNHAILAGSVLAGLALWIGVYAALLPTRGPDLSEPSPTTATTVAVAGTDVPADGPRRWADLPRDSAKCPPPPLDIDGPATSALSDDGGQQDERPPRRIRRQAIRTAALPDAPLAQPLTRQRLSPHARARTRFRRIKEPIQFSLATRSSS